jgi:predicted kinase
MAKTVVIVRGPSGSGKSTYVKEEFGTLPSIRTVVSADDFFMVDGMVPDTSMVVPEGGQPLLVPGRIYEFDPTKLGQAHADCFRRFLMALEAGSRMIIVDNTNIHEWEYMNYVTAAKIAGFAVEIVEFRPETVTEIRTCIARNVHRVPAPVVAMMCVEFEPCPYAEVMKIGRELE